MPRKAKWPPTIHPHSSGQARIRYKGRDIYLGPFGSPEARSRYLQVVAEIERCGSLTPRAADLTVTELCAWWYAYAGRTYAATSREPREIARALAVVRDLFGHEPAAEFGPKKLRLVQAEMARRGWCRNVVNRATVRVKTVFKRAAAEELIPGTVYHGLATVRAVGVNTPGVRQTPPIGPAAWPAVLATFRELMRSKNRIVAAMLLLQWLTGMRSEEVRVLRTADVDLAAGTYRPHKHKNQWRGQERVVPLGRRALLLVRRWLDPARPLAYVFRPELAGPRSRAMKDHYTDSAYGLAVARAAKRAGVALRPYQLRHAFKIRAARVDPHGAQHAMGQKTSAAFDIYGGADLAAAAELARRIG